MDVHRSQMYKTLHEMLMVVVPPWVTLTKFLPYSGPQFAHL